MLHTLVHLICIVSICSKYHTILTTSENWFVQGQTNLIGTDRKWQVQDLNPGLNKDIKSSAVLERA